MGNRSRAVHVTVGLVAELLVLLLTCLAAMRSSYYGTLAIMFAVSTPFVLGGLCLLATRYRAGTVTNPR